jgi:hypothetical protein
MSSSSGDRSNVGATVDESESERPDAGISEADKAPSQETTRRTHDGVAGSCCAVVGSILTAERRSCNGECGVTAAAGHEVHEAHEEHEGKRTKGKKQKTKNKKQKTKNKGPLRGLRAFVNFVISRGRGSVSVCS